MAKPHRLIDVSHLAGDRRAIRSCLNAQDKDERFEVCADVVQVACLPKNPDYLDAATQRRCDWRAIAAWEGEMDDLVISLDAELDGAGRADLKVSQDAWKTSMLADVGLQMNRYQLGSLAGPVAAHVRASSSAGRVIFLEGLRARLRGDT